MPLSALDNISLRCKCIVKQNGELNVRVRLIVLIKTENFCKNKRRPLERKTKDSKRLEELCLLLLTLNGKDGKRMLF